MSDQKTWYVRKGEKTHGPFSPRQLKELAESKKITKDTLVRSPDMSSFVPAANIKGLFSETTSAPIAPTKQPSNDTTPLVPTESFGLPVIVQSIPPIAPIAPPIPPISNPVALTQAESRSPKTFLIVGSAGLLGAVALAILGGLSWLVISSTLLRTTERIVANSEPSVALIRGRVSSGTGFLIEPGLLVTNRHVIAAELIDDLKVHFPSSKQKEELAVQLAYEDPECDLAFLSVNATLPALKRAATHQFRRGEEVTVIGSPGAADDLVLENAISRGVLSTQVTIKGQQYYQLGISINSGNSGGPVLDSSGRVIGVVTLKASEKEGLGFCIPLHELNRVVSRAKALSKNDIAVNRSQHRMRVIVRRVAAAGEMYKLAMHGYTEEMEKAINSRKKADDGLKTARAQIDGVLEKNRTVYRPLEARGCQDQC